MELNEENLYFWLSLCPLSAAKKYKLISNLSIEEIYDRTGKDKKLEDYFGEKAYTRAVALKKPKVIEAELEKMYNAGLGFISYKHDSYPERLRQPEVVPPAGLYYIGDLGVLNNLCVAVVGTRKITDYGKRAAEEISAGFAGYGVSIISGMATGVDAYAQTAALDFGVGTAAVLASGANVPSPMANIGLYRRLCKSGLVVSEYPVSAGAAKHTFPERNRIISGLSQACIIVEADLVSGALITAERAAEQSREVFAVPGSIFSSRSEGTNLLIKNGCQVFTSVKDVLSFFNLQNTKSGKNSTPPALDFFEQTIYNLLQNGEKSIDELHEESGYKLEEVLNIIFSLEFKNLIYKLPNNIFKLRGQLI